MAPTKLQKDVYAKIIESPAVKDVLSGNSTKPLVLIDVLKKCCNSPGLIYKQARNKDLQLKESSIDLSSTLACFPPDTNPNDFALSGKLVALGRLINLLRKETDEKLVIVSNYTKTLEILEAYCKVNKHMYYRLDG